jgi:5'-nucleotidase (lipoprotein e(P4) family)
MSRTASVILRKPMIPQPRFCADTVCPFNQHRLFCKTDSSDKSQRRAQIAGSYRILLLIGDDFNDFATVPEAQANVEGRRAIAKAHDRYWGDRWFMLPNAMYGSWERAVGYDSAKKLRSLQQ